MDDQFILIKKWQAVMTVTITVGCWKLTQKYRKSFILIFELNKFDIPALLIWMKKYSNRDESELDWELV